MIYLDTNIVIWLYSGKTEKISARAMRLLKSEELLISPMVRLELQFLYEAGRMARSPNAVLGNLKEDFGVSVDGVDFAAVIEAAEAEAWTRDPFDRIIAAHAKKNSAILLTSDEDIQANYERALC